MAAGRGIALRTTPVPVTGIAAHARWGNRTRLSIMAVVPLIVQLHGVHLTGIVRLFAPRARF